MSDDGSMSYLPPTVTVNGSGEHRVVMYVSLECFYNCNGKPRRTQCEPSDLQTFRCKKAFVHSTNFSP